MPSRTRTHNVNAAQWSPNGGALGAGRPDPARRQPVFGDNVFSDRRPAPAACPKAVFKQLQETLEQGEPLEPALADAVATAMKEWAMENGATHFTHWFQPLTGSTAEKHDSFYGPTGDGTAIAEFSGKELIQGEPDASSFPTGGIRADLRGARLHRVGPDLAGVHPREPERRGALHPDRVRVVDRRGARPQDPAAALDGRAVAVGRARARLFGDETPTRVFTTVGPEQEYFLIDEQYYFERPDLINTGRTLFGAKPPKGHELDDHYFGSIPERVLACMLETERELAKLGVPIKTRHNEVAPAQYEVAPMFENSNVGSDHQQLTMQMHAERRPPLRARLPAAREAVRRRQRLGQAQQLVDGHRHRRQPARARRHAAREPAVPVLLRGRHPGGQQAPGAAARVGRLRRPGPPPGRQRGAAGDHLDLPRRRAGEGLRRRSSPARATRRRRRAVPRARRVGAAARCRCTAATATARRRSRSPATSSSSARSGSIACRSRSRTRC